MKKIFRLLFLCCILLWIGYLYMGEWLDVTQKPLKSDIIISLGGGDWHRHSQAVNLYEQGYAVKRMLLLTGADITPKMRQEGIMDGRITNLKLHHPNINYAYHPELSSTREEVRFIKTFMVEHGYKSALIVTDPPHTRRVALLSSVIHIPNDDNITFRFVSSGVQWWDKAHYYDNETARNYVMTEILKIPYNMYMLLFGK